MNLLKLTKTISVFKIISKKIPTAYIHPSLEGTLMPSVNERESREHPVLFVTNADKMAAALNNLYGQFFAVQSSLWLIVSPFMNYGFQLLTQ